MAERRARRHAVVVGAAIGAAVALGGCGSGGRFTVDPAEWFGSGESRGTSGSEGGFTVFRGSAEAPAPRPIEASDLVGADGRCSGGAPPEGARRGVGLTMTECELVAAAGTPDQVTIGEEGGARRAVLTYGKGDHPGIYTFVSGRLKIIERVPIPERPEPRRRAPPRQRA